MKGTSGSARPRIRWLTLAELVAVAGVVVAALGLWSNWSDRRAAQADKAEARAEQQTAASRALGRWEPRGTAADDGRTVLLAGDARHELGDVEVLFPAALGVSAQTPADHAIQRDWFAKPLLKLTDGGPDTRTGLLPVLVRYGWTDENGDAHRAAGLYDVVWHTHGRLLGRALDLTGFRRRSKGGDQARLDAAWAREKPAAS